MSKVDISRTITQFPGHIFAKIIIFSACVSKSLCGEDKFIFDLFEKLKTFLKNPLWVFNILNMVYTIYVPWTLRPVLSCHLVLSDPRFTLNKTVFFTASPFVFSATGPHQIIAKFRVH